MISLLSELLKLDWRKRINAIDALKHPYFSNQPLPARPGELPVFEDSHELDRRKFHGQKAALPPAPAGGSVGMGPNGEWTSGSGPRPDVKSNRVPSAVRGGFANGASGGPRRAYDSRVPESVHSHNRHASDDSRGRDWRGDGRSEQRRERQPGRGDGRPAGLDSYVPNYDGADDRHRGRDDGYGSRDHGYERTRRRSRSPDSHNFYRR